MFNFTAPLPLALYIHIPWCVRKCPYCDFNSHALRSDLPEKQYINALIEDLERELPLIWGRRITSIFIGGGTPSLLSPEAIDRLLSELRARLSLNPDIEITLEANPGTFEQVKFSEFFSAGINRLSVGIQSFHSDLLQNLGRIHNGREAIDAVNIAHAAGFENINLDLMFGLPGQSKAQAEADIAAAVDLEPAHISFYQLTLEPNTFFYQQPPMLPKEDDIWDMQENCHAKLSASGYSQYEVSAFARDGMQSRHNLNYWKFGDYLGIGAGAHGKITNIPQQSIVRRWKIKHPQDYMNKVKTQEYIGGETRLTRTDASFEFMMNVLRLTEGFPSNLFTERTGLPVLRVEASLNQAQRQGLLIWDTHRICPTDKGKQFLNDLVAMFLPEENKKRGV